MAQETLADRMSVSDKQARVKELLEYHKSLPTEAQLMRECLEVVSNTTVAAGMRANAVYVLKELIEPIDNANSMQPLLPACRTCLSTFKGPCYPLAAYACH